MDRRRVVPTFIVTVSVVVFYGIYKLFQRRNNTERCRCKSNDCIQCGSSPPDGTHEVPCGNEARGDDIDSSNPDQSVPTGNLYTTDKAQLTSLEAVGQSTSGQLSQNEAEILVSMLSSATEGETLQQVLSTVGNAAAFTANQNSLREAGALPRLNSLLRAHSMALKVGQSVTYPAVVNGVISSINNMAMNEHNQIQLKECIPTLIDFASTDKADESIQLASLQALTNLSIKPEYHEPYTKLIQQLYEYLDSGAPGIQLQAMKVLANLSTNVHMVPHLLAAKSPRCLFELLTPDVSTDFLVRWTSILANVMCIVRDTGLTAGTLPPEYKAPSPETTYTALYGHNNINKFKSKVFVLSRHGDSEVRHHASRIYGCLT